MSLADGAGYLEADGRAVVCGLGDSLDPILAALELELDKRKGIPRPLLVGVNDVADRADVDVLVLIDELDRFKGPRLATIKRTRPRLLVHLFEDAATLKLGASCEVCRIQITAPERRPDLQVCRGGIFPSGWTSAYAAVLVAWICGATRIGVAGMDFPPSRSQSVELPWIDKAFAGLAEVLAEEGVQVWNLSPSSWVSGLRQGGLRDLLA